MISQLSAARLGTKLLVLGTIAVFLIGLGAAGGLRWNHGEVVEAEAARDKTERERDDWKANAAGLRRGAAAQNEETRKAKVAAAVEKQRSDEAVARADAAAERFLQRQEQLEREHAADHRNPDCARQMEMPVCGSPLH